MRPDALTSAELLAAGAIVAVQAAQRGLEQWTRLADRLTREAAARAVERIEEENDG